MLVTKINRKVKVIILVIAIATPLNLQAIKTEGVQVQGNPINVPIGKIEVTTSSRIKEGLITLISPTTGITSFHLLNGWKSASINFGKEQKAIKWVNPLKRTLQTKPNAQKLHDLYDDVCIVGWDDHLPVKNMHFPLVSTRHPNPDELIYIPTTTQTGISWEKRYIVGLEEFAAWTNLPKKIYSIILYLNGRPTNKGNILKEGDSGGGWISTNGELLAVTSRVVNEPLGPTSQIVYGTLLHNHPSPKKSGEKSRLATTPLLISILILSLITTIIVVKKYLYQNKKYLKLK